MAGVLIIGAGQAGFATAAALRARGYGGAITLIGAEAMAPYQRPPLSKAYLLGQLSDDRLLLKPEGFYPEQGIGLRTGTAALAIDPVRRRVETDAGELAYDQLVLATGTAPRRLDPALTGGLAGIHYLRSAADTQGLRADLAPGRRLMVLGGGYVGLEVAAAAAQLGVRVTVVEAAGRILQRVAAAETSAYFRALHARHGVAIREGTGLAQLHGTNGRAARATLSDGSTLEIDALLAGIGVTPETGLAQAAGLAIDNGIAVDACGRTSAPGIWAVGDCCSFPFAGGRIRLESVPHALDQAAVVAAGILGAPAPYRARPWFWSDQYDVKLQIAGLNAGYDQIVTRGDQGGPFSVWYYRGGRLLAVDAMNDARVYMIARRLLDQGLSPRPELAGRTDLDPRAFLESAAV